MVLHSCSAFKALPLRSSNSTGAAERLEGNVVLDYISTVTLPDGSKLGAGGLGWLCHVSAQDGVGGDGWKQSSLSRPGIK